METPGELYEEKEEQTVWAQPVESQAEKQGEAKCMGWNSQVADMRKPFLAVRGIIEKGNHVTFGPSPQDNHIINKMTGDKMMLQSDWKDHI